MLTTQQLATLKTDIQSRANLWSNGTQQIGDQEVATFYNTVAEPAVPIWKKDVDITQLNSAVNWSDMAALTQEKQLAYQSMVWANVIDMTDVQVRGGVDAIFGNPSSSRTGILAIGKRNATYLEALFATGGATKISAVYNNSLSASEVSAAING